MRFVRNFENAVYEIATRPAPSFLRITPSTHHSRAEVESELSFVRFLGEEGLPVAQPIVDHGGSFVVTTQLDGVGLTACVVEQAPGLSYDDQDDQSQYREPAPPSDVPYQTFCGT